MNTFKMPAAPPDAAPSKAEQTRSRILTAALELFRRRGFDPTTMREIAAEAGVALGSAYYYFASKETLVMAFYERASEEMSAQAEALNHIVEQLRSMVGGEGHKGQMPKAEASRPKAPARSTGVTKSLAALKSAVTSPKPVKTAVPAGSRSSIPLEDNFTEM